MAGKDPQARPEREDLGRVVEAHGGQGARAVPPGKEAVDAGGRVQPVCNGLLPACRAEPAPVAQGDDRRREAERDGDRPRQRHTPGDARAPRQEHDRGHARCRGQRDPLQRTEADHSPLRVSPVAAGELQRLAVGGEAAARDEDAEAAGDERCGVGEPELWPALHAGDLAVGRDVSDVGHDLRGDGDTEPVPRGSDEQVLDRAEAGRPRDACQRSEGQDAAEPDEEDECPRSVRQVMRPKERAERSQESHLSAVDLAAHEPRYLKRG